jgi:hypothetical protein
MRRASASRRSYPRPLYDHNVSAIPNDVMIASQMDLARQMHTMNLASPNLSQPVRPSAPYLEAPRPLHRNKSAPQVQHVHIGRVRARHITSAASKLLGVCLDKLPNHAQ